MKAIFLFFDLVDHLEFAASRHYYDDYILSLLCLDCHNPIKYSKNIKLISVHGDIQNLFLLDSR